MQLKGKVIIVTGGTKGIGRAIALASAREGAKVVVGGRNEADGAALEEECRKDKNEGEILFVKGDLTVEACCKELVDTAVSVFGKLDGLVNYAGTVISMAPITETTEEQYQFIMDTNFKSCFFCDEIRGLCDEREWRRINYQYGFHACIWR